MCEVNKILTNPHCGYSSRWFMSLDDFCDLAVQAACNLGSYNRYKVRVNWRDRWCVTKFSHYNFFFNLYTDIKRRIFDQWGFCLFNFFFGPNLKKLPTKGWKRKAYAKKRINIPLKLIILLASFFKHRQSRRFGLYEAKLLVLEIQTNNLNLYIDFTYCYALTSTRDCLVVRNILFFHRHRKAGYQQHTVSSCTTETYLNIWGWKWYSVSQFPGRVVNKVYYHQLDGAIKRYAYIPEKIIKFMICLHLHEYIIDL